MFNIHCLWWGNPCHKRHNWIHLFEIFAIRPNSWKKKIYESKITRIKERILLIIKPGQVTQSMIMPSESIQILKRNQSLLLSNLNDVMKVDKVYFQIWLIFKDFKIMMWLSKLVLREHLCTHRQNVLKVSLLSWIWHWPWPWGRQRTRQVAWSYLVLSCLQWRC